ncbi:MAG: glycosyl hydrolase [Pseudomonadota bacterium]
MREWIGVFMGLSWVLGAGAASQAPWHQGQGALIDDTVRAVAYSGYRRGQHPDRGQGAVNPSREQILEDLHLLVDHGFHLIRQYDTGAVSRLTLSLIAEHDLPIRVLQGAWLRAELSNHEGCAWLDEPIPDEQLAANRQRNEREVRELIALVKRYPSVISAVNVGNEALVEWNDHLVPLARVIAYVRQVREAIEQPVTVAENYDWWVREGSPLARELDFLGIHTYPVWEGRAIDEGVPFTAANVRAVVEALPDKPIAILEAGWATTAVEFGERAGEEAQAKYFTELERWAREANVTVFFFEAFDEPWKGDPTNALGAEKHWGLFDVDRAPKAALREEDG